MNMLQNVARWYFSKRALPFWVILLLDCLMVVMSVIMVVIGCMCSYSLIPIEGGNELAFFGVSLFDVFDILTSYVILPIGGLLILLFLGWFYKKEDLYDILVVETKCSEGLFKVYYFFLRFIAPLLLLIVFLQQLGVF